MSAAARTDNRLDLSAKPPQTTATSEYCAKLQRWIWQSYWAYASWQSWLCLSTFPPPCAFPPPETSAHTAGAHASTSSQQRFDTRNWSSSPAPPGGAQSGRTAASGPEPRPAEDPARAGVWSTAVYSLIIWLMIQERRGLKCLHGNEACMLVLQPLIIYFQVTTWPRKDPTNLCLLTRILWQV